MGRLTTHVLDAAHGCPGSSIKIELYRVEGSHLQQVASALTNSDGRCDAPLLQGDDYRSGVYQLQFHAGDYYRARGCNCPIRLSSTWWCCASAFQPSRSTTTCPC
ncbi:hypothetical protein PHLH5_39910 [Pseudomonas sp. Cab53]|nr:hypothetical protein PHLH5_39910 [Pseudomonas sp. Cab53]